uniref:RRM domain-containing protein n=1 Tax=Zonotrichia albicollis TaxID=44394 RepID=A0A8D2NCG9_ZONAL
MHSSKSYWISSCCLQQAIEEEGGDPDEIPVASELTTKRMPKRTSKGRKPEEEGVEDNGLEENSRDGQEDIEANLDTLQDIDMMDISVLDEAEIDNSSAVDCGEDYSPDNILDSLSDNKDNVEAEMKELPDQLTENEEDYDEIENNLEASSDLIEMKKILDILGETCKSELLNEEQPPEAERPRAQEASNVGPGKRLAEEEDALAAAQLEEDALALDSKSAQALARKEAKRLVVAKGETSEQSPEEEAPDSEGVVVETLSDQSSKRSQGLEASSGEAAEKGAGAEARASKEDGKRAEDKANSEESSPATKESSASEGADQKKSPVEEDRDTKIISKDEKGRSAGSSGRNFWVSGLASTTRATDLKNLFSKYGKVVGAKVVTNARSPGARCYGFVTMSTAEEATKCITHLHKTELHGKIISVEKAKNEPAGKKTSEKKESEAKRETVSAWIRWSEKIDFEERVKCQFSHFSEHGVAMSGVGHKIPFFLLLIHLGSKGTERTVVMDKSKGEPVISVKTSTTSKDRSVKSQDRKSESRERQGIVPFDKIKAQRKMRESVVCSRRDDPYWPEAKRMAMNDRYHSDFSRQDRFHDFDHRDRGRYQEHSIDRLVWLWLSGERHFRWAFGSTKASPRLAPGIRGRRTRCYFG